MTKGFDPRWDRPRAGDWLDAEIKNALDAALNEGTPIEGYLIDESPVEIPDEAWGGPRQSAIDDAEDNLIFSVEVVEAEPDPEPVPPTGVVVHFTNGESQKVELVYTGVDDRGLHTWEVTTRPRFREVDRVTVEVMPPMTQIHMGGPGGP